MSSSPGKAYESTQNLPENGSTMMSNPEYSKLATDSESHVLTTTKPMMRMSDSIAAGLDTTLSTNIGVTDKNNSEGHTTHNLVQSTISTSGYKKLWEMVYKNSREFHVDKTPYEATYGSTLGVLGIVLVCVMLCLLILSDLRILHLHFKQMMLINLHVCQR